MTAVVDQSVEERAAEDHSGRRPDDAPERIDVCVLGAQIVAGAAKVASTTAAWVEMVGVFDAANGAGQLWMDSTAQWLAFACSMSAGTAREHVRIARALRQMPIVAEAFSDGVLSFSKIRECTRLVGQIDEHTLVTVARDFTAAQLERAVRGFRAGRSERLVAEAERKLTHRELADGGVQTPAVLPAEEAAIVLNALEVARARYRQHVEDTAEAMSSQPDLQAQDDPNIVPRECYVWEVEGDTRRRVPLKELGQNTDDTAPQTPSYTRADALIDLARGYLDAGPADVSGEDRDLVVVHIDARDPHPVDPPADQTATEQPAAGQPTTEQTVAEGPAADTRCANDPAPAESAVGVPAGTPTADPGTGTGAGSGFGPGADRQAASRPGRRVDPAVDPERAIRPRAGWIEQTGWIHPSTAARILCTGQHQRVVIGTDGQVLHLGRTQRLVSRAQRRALMARDRTCRFPGCIRATRLHAHHIHYWSLGGPTDIENLILLCHHHHVLAHAASITITKRRGTPGWHFTRIDGSTITAQSRNHYSRPSPIDDDPPWPSRTSYASSPTTPASSITPRRADDASPSTTPPHPTWLGPPEQMQTIRERTSFYDHDHNVFPRWAGERLTEGDYWELLEPRATTPRTNPEARY
ncbi:HNH endonuclease signature motif containing protein [Blastococcus sp. Marseille-P5729]|uniref:HNH endonuclease n=1 Tax=Blastococcus sp. Marseille-P5729 TaxID=2086582 RepID=UPI000D0ECFC3|nr:HNH endonuclease signature motif containing protein [Blastococcus sp. Marseille-P5729]